MEAKLFNRHSIYDYYRAVIEGIRRDVESQDDVYLLSVNIDEYAEYLLNKYSLPKIEFDNNRDNTIEKIRKTFEVNRFGEKEQIEEPWARVMLPVIPNDKIADVLRRIPSTVTLAPPKMEYSNGFIITESPFNDSAVDNVIKQIYQEVEWRNADIEKQKEELKREIRNIIDSRIAKIKDEDAILEKITQKVSVPLRLKNSSSPLPTDSLKVKQKIQPIIPPKANKPVEPQLEPNKFNAIIELINNCCMSFETTPMTFSKMEEESLRNVILSSLNSIFEGEAVGEAFSKLGKTDIRLKVVKGDIFIAECKYWKGPNTVDETVDQILRYLTWRNSYGVIILFSRNKGFSTVIDSLSGMISKVPNYVKGFEKVDDRHFKAQYKLPEDERKLIEMHFMIYNLYAEANK
jgi:hypothetical protein